ncbi:hypothetical protein M5D96_013659, partial [Drosophila gunungcola]
FSIKVFRQYWPPFVFVLFHCVEPPLTKLHFTFTFTYILQSTYLQNKKNHNYKQYTYPPARNINYVSPLLVKKLHATIHLIFPVGAANKIQNCPIAFFTYILLSDLLTFYSLSENTYLQRLQTYIFFL